MALGRVVKNPGAKSIPKLKKLGYKKRGGKYPNTWVLPGGQQRPNRPKTTKPDPMAYSQYEQYPFFQRELIDSNRAQEHHENYAKEVGAWLAPALANLTGVNPGSEGINAQAQQRYQANIAGSVGSALGAAAAATPMTPGALSPGGVPGSQYAFLGDAARQASAQRSSAALQSAQAQANLNTLQNNIMSQGIMRAYADMQAGLPGQYAQRRAERMAAMDKFIMEWEEQKRQARVQESLAARQADAQTALAYAQLGLDEQKFLADQEAAQAAGSAPAPPGYYRDPVSGDLVRDRAFVEPGSGGGGGGGQSGSTTRDAQGRLRPPVLRERGWKQLPKKYKLKDVNKKNWQHYVGADGRLWIKPRTGSGGGGGSTSPGSSRDYQANFQEWYFDNVHGKDNIDVPQAVSMVGNRVYAMRNRFTMRDGHVNKNKLAKMLQDTIGTGTVNIPAQVMEWLERKWRNGKWV